MDERARQRLLLDHIPDVRDGLTRPQRLLLLTIAEVQAELGGRDAPSSMIYGRLIEKGVNVSPEEMQRMLARLGAL